MARSKIKGTKGKPVKKAKNKDTLKASIHYGDAIQHGKRYESTAKHNDGDPTVYHQKTRWANDDSSVKTTETKVKNVESARYPLKGKSKKSWAGKGASTYSTSQGSEARRKATKNASHVRALKKTRDHSTKKSSKRF